MWISLPGCCPNPPFWYFWFISLVLLELSTPQAEVRFLTWMAVHRWLLTAVGIYSPIQVLARGFQFTFLTGGGIKSTRTDPNLGKSLWKLRDTCLGVTNSIGHIYENKKTQMNYDPFILFLPNTCFGVSSRVGRGEIWGEKNEIRCCTIFQHLKFEREKRKKRKNWGLGKFCANPTLHL